MAELKNARHEKFAQGIASGMRQRPAYRAAFPSSEKWKDATVDKRASELYNTEAINERVRELSAQASTEAIMTAIQRKEWLSRIIRSDEEMTKDKLKAIDLLNRMEGEYTDNLKVTGDVKNPFEGLTTEELKKLVYDE